jgi:hypothetical protein
MPNRNTLLGLLFKANSMFCLTHLPLEYGDVCVYVCVCVCKYTYKYIYGQTHLNILPMLFYNLD